LEGDFLFFGLLFSIELLPLGRELGVQFDFLVADLGSL
jgi:hypothetical protein